MPHLVYVIQILKRGLKTPNLLYRRVKRPLTRLSYSRNQKFAIIQAVIRKLTLNRCFHRQ